MQGVPHVPRPEPSDDEETQATKLSQWEVWPRTNPAGHATKGNSTAQVKRLVASCLWRQSVIL